MPPAPPKRALAKAPQPDEESVLKRRKSAAAAKPAAKPAAAKAHPPRQLSLIHISEPTRLALI
eukprot:2375959-Alexandrium_andersonii.AAC.1